MRKSKTYYAAFTDWRNNPVNVIRGRKDPALSNAAGTSKWREDGAFLGVKSSRYWSSTHNNDTNDAWYMKLNGGDIYYNPKTKAYYVWPVRGDIDDLIL